MAPDPHRLRRALRALGPHWPRAAAAALAVGAVGEVLASERIRPLALYVPVALAMSLPVAVMRRFPLAVVIVVYGTLFIPVADGVANDTVFLTFSLAITAYGVGAYAPPLRAAAGLGVILAALVGITPADPANPDYGDSVFLGVLFGLPWALGFALHRRGIENVTLSERADLLEREREHLARIAVSEERARIARELHDIVAHSVSVISVQTAAVRRRLQAEHPAEAAALLTVEATSRQALAEMRRLLGVLRDDGEQPSLSPQPGLNDLERLAEQVGAAGLPVELRVEGTPTQLPPGLDLAGYRIVQEALTNSLRHAGPARARVIVRHRPDAIEFDITDDGRPDPAATPGGHGLIGLRERAALYGGALTAGPEPTGGFAVRAWLPIEPGDRA